MVDARPEVSKVGVPINAERLKEMAHACGFELAGVADALPSEDLERFEDWCTAGNAGEMRYLTDHRGDLRADPRNLLANALSIVCVGKLYQTPHPLSITQEDDARGWISRYAWGRDYHEVMRSGLERLMAMIMEAHGEPFE